MIDARTADEANQLKAPDRPRRQGPSRKAAELVYGIRCTLTNRNARREVSSVLKAIRNQTPEDFRRLQHQVIVIEDLPREVTGADGRTVRRKTDRPPQRARFDIPARIQLSTLGPALVATAAHELGHVCTRRWDALKRYIAGAPALWSEELCADYYAYKWGFGRAIAVDRLRRRDIALNLPRPGAAVTIAIPLQRSEAKFTFRVTRHFYLRLVSQSLQGKEIALPGELAKLVEIVRNNLENQWPQLVAGLHASIYTAG
jgi:hypothetical protein